MKIQLESTGKYKVIHGKQHRAWIGRTELGVQITAYIVSIEIHEPQQADLKEFESDLVKLPVG